MSDDTRWDGVFMNVIQQKQGIDGFFECIFSFLRRSTDFFQDQKRAEKVMIEQCKRQYDIFEKDQAGKKKKDEEKKKREEALKAEKEKKRLAEDAIKKQKAEEEALKNATSTEEKPKQETIVQKEEANKEEKKDDDKKDKDEDDKTPPPLGNGGKTDLYIWTQTLEELHMYIYLDSEVTKKNLKVNIEPKKFFLSVNGKTVIDGEWTEQIHADGTLWTIETGEFQDYNGKVLHISVEKWKSQFHWWDSPIKGHPKINTQKISPESSNLSDLDGETRGTVEKMMFDMRQKQMGKPSSDELMKQDKLKDFMKAHPEMDFSKCKFN